MSKVVQFQPRIPSILRIIREVVQDSSRIRLGPAIQAEFATGLISFRQVMNGLQKGQISIGPYPDDYGMTCCELELITAGRWVRVVVSIEGKTPNGRILHVLFAEEI